MPKKVQRKPFKTLANQKPTLEKSARGGSAFGRKKRPQKKIKEKPLLRKIDAQGQILGRLASEIAIVLIGKDKVSFRRNLVSGDRVLVLNARKMKVTGKKLENKKYFHHTGYLGHLKSENLADLMKVQPREVLKRAVWGMLPKNKLRKLWMKNLEIRDEE